MGREFVRPILRVFRGDIGIVDIDGECGIANDRGESGLLGEAAFMCGVDADVGSSVFFFFSIVIRDLLMHIQASLLLEMALLFDSSLALSCTALG